MNRVQELIGLLGLATHPEGGYFKETYRSDKIVTSPTVNDRRSAVTDIYFLLTKGQYSRFHKVSHDELWNFYEGDPLRLYDFYPQTNQLSVVSLGPISQNNSYKYVIRANHWQAAEPLGEYALVGCTVAPGFDFRDFSFLDEQSPEKEQLLDKFPEYGKFL